MTAFDIATAKERFPALKKDDQVYLDNAGGSQVLGDVIDSQVHPLPCSIYMRL